MDSRTRAQLLEINRAFYAAHAAAFDRSRSGRPWPGWQRVVEHLPVDRPLGPVLDVGCGNARFACFLAEAGVDFDYVGVDASRALLEAARRQLPAPLAGRSRLIELDFLASDDPGEALPRGPFRLIALMGILHHVPGADWRLALLRAAANRLAPDGLLALAAWQFADEPREQRKRVDLETLGPVLGHPLDPSALEPGDQLLRFGEDRSAPPRFCHAVDDAEFERWPAALGLACAADYRADGPASRSNRYALLRRT